LGVEDWNPAQYLEFGSERTRPAIDLVAAINLDSPQRVVDLGCGPGNSTQVLRSRWPDAKITGVDSSAAMIAAAEGLYSDQTWVCADARTWKSNEPVDLVFSNAALQWMRNHEQLIPRLFGLSAGALAFQIPSANFAEVRKQIHELSRDDRWNERTESARQALTMQQPAAYYDLLSPLAGRIDIWETEYIHVMESAAAIIEWMSGTGLRPFLAGLADESERQSFLGELGQRVAVAYPPQTDGKVLFPFRRTFVVAYH